MADKKQKVVAATPEVMEFLRKGINGQKIDLSVEKRTKTYRRSGGGAKLVPAMTQEAFQADGTVSVKVLDGDGAVVAASTAFDVSTNASEGAITVADYVASDGQDITATGVKVLVQKDKFGVWRLIEPVLLNRKETGQLVPVIVQEDLQNTKSVVSVKFTTSGGAAVGTAFDVNVMSDYSTIIDKTDYVPYDIGSESGMICKDYHGNWVLVRPDIQKSGSCA